MSDLDEEAQAAAHFSGHLPQAHSNQTKYANADACVKRRKIACLGEPICTCIHLSRVEVVGIEFEANEGSSSYIKPGSRYYQDGQNFRNGWKKIKASDDTRVLHYHYTKRCAPYQWETSKPAGTIAIPKHFGLQYPGACTRARHCCCRPGSVISAKTVRGLATLISYSP